MTVIMPDEKYYIGIDNGVTGSIAVINLTPTVVRWAPTPTWSDTHYNKSKMKTFRRVNVEEIALILAPYITKPCFVLLERPFINPKAFDTSLNAMASYIETKALIEKLRVPYDYFDSRQWQRKLLPDGCEGGAALKKASRDVAKRLFPTLILPNGADGDAVLLAEYGRREGL